MSDKNSDGYAGNFSTGTGDVFCRSPLDPSIIYSLPRSGLSSAACLSPAACPEVFHAGLPERAPPEPLRCRNIIIACLREFPLRMIFLPWPVDESGNGVTCLPGWIHYNEERCVISFSCRRMDHDSCQGGRHVVVHYAAWCAEQLGVSLQTVSIFRMSVLPAPPLSPSSWSPCRWRTADTIVCLGIPHRDDDACS